MCCDSGDIVAIIIVLPCNIVGVHSIVFRGEINGCYDKYNVVTFINVLNLQLPPNESRSTDVIILFRYGTIIIDMQ